MLKNYFPNAYAHSVFSIDYKKLYDLGYRGIIFDIDNTLVPHGESSNSRIDKLFSDIKEIGFKTLLLSDNNEGRIKRFNQNIGSLYISEAGKPNTVCYEKAIYMLELEKEKTVCIGDQIFKDILGANKSNIESILVDFIRRSGEKKIGKKRYIEKLIILIFKKSKAYNHRLKNVILAEEK